MPQWVHRFGSGMAAVGDLDPDVVGVKGGGLARAAKVGLPVPPGFTLSTAACRAFHDNDGVIPTEISAAVDTAVRSIEAATGRTLGGSPDRALTLAVRCSPSHVATVPGIMPTVQDLGLPRNGDAARAARVEAMFLRSAHDADEEALEDALDAVDPLAELDSLRRRYNDAPSPDEPRERLFAALRSGFRSWNAPRAVDFRRTRGLPEACGLAIVVQAMVGSVAQEVAMVGAARTRNADTGEPGLRGYFARGDGTIGDASPAAIRRLAVREGKGSPENTLERSEPQLYAMIEAAARVLERAERHPVDIKFAVGRGRKREDVWILHASHAPLAARANIRVAVDMVGEGLIDERQAVLRVDPNSLDQVLHARIAPDGPRRVIGRGFSAAPGAATGEIAFGTAEVRAAREAGRSAILVCTETGPDDIGGIQAAEGVLTTRGGLTSHAAVVARGLGRPCVTGAGSLRVGHGELHADGEILRQGDPITLDGSTGEVLAGRFELVPPEMSGDFATLMDWADNARRLRVRANADTPEDARVARRFGAEGIGLCRTEHMMADPSRANPMREMILAETDEKRSAAIARLLPLQREDFVTLFEAMAGFPVMVRLLDPPLHEFLPYGGTDLRAVADTLGMSFEHLSARVEALRETNPMLGHRGCRLAISYPEIARMQVRAIVEAAGEVGARTGRPVEPEIMVPLVAMLDELEHVKGIIDDEAAAVERDTGRHVRYRVGTMIELPRAALRADDIARAAEFFSFGTNDLTQTTFGISRDDASPFLGRYREVGIMDTDPFATIDRRGVGRLVRVACELGREVRPDIALSICGEHGGDPASIEFCEMIGLDYVSCSPYRVPIARLAAAQAAIRGA